MELVTIAFLVGAFFVLLAMSGGNVPIAYKDAKSRFPKISDPWRLGALVVGLVCFAPAALKVVEPKFVSDAPIGSVVAFAGDLGNNVPTGWLPCNGSALLSREYPKLFAVIRTSHGNGIDPKSSQKLGDFNVPDYRGRFLRGVDEGSDRDPDRKKRTPSQLGGNEKDSVGSVQPDAFAKHNHPMPYGNGTVQSGSGAGGNTTASSLDTQQRGDSDETRPKNIYVYFIIRAS
jgi:microcystin-dependent protein